MKFFSFAASSATVAVLSACSGSSSSPPSEPAPTVSTDAGSLPPMPACCDAASPAITGARLAGRPARDGGSVSTDAGASSTGRAAGTDGAASADGSSCCAPASAFPLAISTNRKYLVDARGNPFFIQGDSPWSLEAELSDDDAVAYLDDRRSRGFSAIVFEVMEHKFTSQSPPLNAAGIAPFTDASDFTTTNEAYFAHLDWLVQQAEQRGILVFLAPAYLGAACDDEGWCTEMQANGVSKLQQYGAYLGARYRNSPNIVWVEGGDDTPSTNGSPSVMDLVNAVASGIIAGDGGSHYHTAHFGVETAGSDVPGLAWLSLDSSYTYATPQVDATMLPLFARDDGARPLFFIEGEYENEHSATRRDVRAQMYEPVLCGGMGFMYGSDPVWFFGSAGDDNPGWSLSDSTAEPFSSWRDGLGSPGAQDATRAGSFFASLPWYALRPDASHAILTGGYDDGGGGDSAVLASTPDGRVAVAYFTGPVSATIDLSKLSGGQVTARWFDPSAGTYTPALGRVDAGAVPVTFTPPGARADGSADWVLVLTITSP